MSFRPILIPLLTGERSGGVAGQPSLLKLAGKGFAKAEAAVSGSDPTRADDPLPHPGTVIYGAAVDIDGAMPDIIRTPVSYALFVTSQSVNMTQAGVATLWTVRPFAQIFPYFEYNGNRIEFGSGGSLDYWAPDNGSISGSSKVTNYGSESGGFRVGVNARTDFRYGSWSQLFAWNPQTWWVPPESAVIPDKVGFRLRVNSCSATFSAKIAIWWGG